MTISAIQIPADEMSRGIEFLPEGRSLVEGGGIELSKYRIAFQTAMGRPTTATDDMLLTVIGMDSEGDYTPMIDVGTAENTELEWFVSRVLALETSVPPTTQTTAAVTGMSLTVVQDDVNGFEQGVQLTKQADITRYLRLVFNIAQRAGELPEWKFADDVIADIIRRTPRPDGMEDDDYEDAIIEAMTSFDPQLLPDLSTQDRINQDALSHDSRIELAASVLNKDAELLGVLSRIDVSNKVVMMSSVDVYERLKAMTASGALDFDGLIAEPGTEKTHVVGTNKPYDKYIKYVNGKAKTFSEIDGIAMRLLPIATAKTKSGEHSENIKKEQFEALARADKATEDSTVTVLKRAFREACSLIHQLNKFDRFHEYARNEDGSLMLDKDNNPFVPGILRVAIHVDASNPKVRRTTPKPVHIWESNRPTATGSYSVREFIKFRPNMIASTAGLETLLKDYKDSITERQGETPTGEALPKNLEELRGKLNYFATLISEPKLFNMLKDSMLKPDGAEDVSSADIIQQRLELLLNVTKASQKPQGGRDALIQGAAKRQQGASK